MQTFNITKLEARHEFKRSGEIKKAHHKIYIFVDNETILENLMNRRNRPYKWYKENVLPKALEQLKKTDPVSYELIKDAKWSWSQSCGCSMCPCSPGFISDTKNYSNHRTLFITIK